MRTQTHAYSSPYAETAPPQGAFSFPPCRYNCVSSFLLSVVTETPDEINIIKREKFVAQEGTGVGEDRIKGEERLATEKLHQLQNHLE